MGIDERMGPKSYDFPAKKKLLRRMSRGGGSGSAEKATSRFHVFIHHDPLGLGENGFPLWLRGKSVSKVSV